MGQKKDRERGREGKAVERMQLDMGELEAILDRAKDGPLSEEDRGKLLAALETLLFLTQELEKKRVSIQRLKKALFGDTTEKTERIARKVLKEAEAALGAEEAQGGRASEKAKPKAKGHGRNSAKAYTGGKRVPVELEGVTCGQSCPACRKGKLYEKEPERIPRFTGQPPVTVTVYEKQRLRCSGCGKTFVADSPAEVGEEKYDAESASMIANLKYGCGMPFNRLDKLQGNLEIPLPASTQWDMVAEDSEGKEPVFAELIRRAAQGKVVYHDDTKMRVTSLAEVDTGRGAQRTEEPSGGEQAGEGPPDRAPGAHKGVEEGNGDCPGQEAREGAAEVEDGSTRTGVFTTAIVSEVGEQKIALFLTGPNHAGENLVEVLEQRAAELERPIQMCDALASNMPQELKTILANCLTHGRRQFVDVAGSFPDECLHVLRLLGKVYKNDARAKQQNMTPLERLRFHQAESKPVMDELKEWITAQMDHKKVEPNSGLGGAIRYMLKRWDQLTLFLRVPGAPLDNSICERAIKKAVLHRKNAYFYRTLKGAHVGDLYMSLIHTCELNGVNSFHYLTALGKNVAASCERPADWMPWNYQQNLQPRSPPTSK